MKGKDHHYCWATDPYGGPRIAIMSTSLEQVNGWPWDQVFGGRFYCWAESKEAATTECDRLNEAEPVLDNICYPKG